jgi:hypothetical protein
MDPSVSKVATLTLPGQFLSQLFDWHRNADDGKSVVQGFFSGADSFWQRQINDFSNWNAANPDTPIGLPNDDIEANCTFSGDDPPPGGKHNFRDAVWIKRYNAGTLPNDPDNFYLLD